MKNVANFYTLKYIKTIFLLIILITAVFCALYLIIFDLIYKDLISISGLNITLFQSTIWMSNIVSSLVSMRYVYNSTLIDYPIRYNSFIPNKTEYFEALRSYSFDWYKKIITNFGNIEKTIHFYYNSTESIFWLNIPVSYPDLGIINQDFETFPLSLSMALSENNELLKNKFFSINYLNNLKTSSVKGSFSTNLPTNSNTNAGEKASFVSNTNINSTISSTNVNPNAIAINTTNKQQTQNLTQSSDKGSQVQVISSAIENNNINDKAAHANGNSNLLDNNNQIKIEFSGYLSVENSINNLLPKMLDLLRTIPSEFQNYNIGNMKFIIIIIIAYGFTMLLLMCFYSIFLYLTSNNMQEGLEKVCRIKLTCIEETIKRIESFNDKSLSKYRQREAKNLTEDSKDLTSERANEKSHAEKYGNFGEGASYKSLKILSHSYLQILVIILIICAMLIPIYFVSYGMISDSNKILSVQNYIFGKSLTASASTVSIKCMISVCKIEKNLDYSIEFVDRTQIENIIRDIAEFRELSDFYNNKFLLNACLVISNDTTSSMYSKCMNDTVIKSANNTDSLLKLVDETVDTISKDKDMKLGKAYLFANNKTVIFSNPLLFETNYFKDLEYVFYNYITPISDNFADIVSLSLNNYLLNQRTIIIILICILGLIILLFASYIEFVFTNALIRLLSVSRCIFRIIPTNVITNTAELEIWLENKY